DIGDCCAFQFRNGPRIPPLPERERPHRWCPLRAPAYPKRAASHVREPPFIFSKHGTPSPQLCFRRDMVCAHLGGTPERPPFLSPDFKSQPPGSPSLVEPSRGDNCQGRSALCSDGANRLFYSRSPTFSANNRHD